MASKQVVLLRSWALSALSALLHISRHQGLRKISGSRIIGDHLSLESSKVTGDYRSYVRIAGLEIADCSFAPRFYFLSYPRYQDKSRCISGRRHSKKKESQGICSEYKKISLLTKIMLGRFEEGCIIST